jgi:hypothetical protein
MPKAENTIKEKQRPSHEQREHEPVHHIKHVIHLATMGRKAFRNA